MVDNFTETEAVLSMASHRLLPLFGDDVAVMSDRSTGWAVVRRSEYDMITSYLSESKRTLQTVNNKTRRVLKTIWDSGLLLSNGAPHPSTIFKQSLYPSAILLKLTGSCNLECSYCYDYDTKRFKTQLNLDKIKEIISFLLPRQPFLSIIFHGGEPLLRFDMIKEVVEYTLKQTGSSTSVSFSIQTNGTRFNKEVISFLERHQFSVGISLDGPNEASNSLRKVRGKSTPLNSIKKLYEQYPQFLRDRCTFLAVVSKTSAPHIPQFALWLQEMGISGLSITFLDLVGRGENLHHELLTPNEAVDLYRKFVDMIRKKEIKELSLNNLIGKINNLFTFQPKDLCQKGPCGASGDFLVLDSEGKFRTCDCIYNSYFEIGAKQISESINSSARNAVVERHAWLRENGETCSTCPLFGVCGGTCVAKAISQSGNPQSVDPIECAISHYIYPELLNEFVAQQKMPLFEYYSLHKNHTKGISVYEQFN